MSESEIQSWDVADITSIATTVVTEARLNNDKSMDVPAWARSILAVKPIIANVTPTAAEPIIAQLRLATCPKIAPFTVLFNPLGAIVGTTGDQSKGKAEVFPINCPVNGGEKLDAYIKMLAASTGVIKATVAVLYSSLPPPSPHYHAEIGTLTATTTAVGEAAANAFTIANVKKIHELIGIAAQTTVTVVQPLIGHFRFLSSGFPVVPCKLPAETVDAVLLTVGAPLTHMSRAKVSLPTNPICVITTYFNLQVALTVAGKFIAGVVFEQLSD